MAFATYSDLQSEIASILHRSNLTSAIQNFIALAEASINRVLRVRVMETDNSLTLSSGARTVALPTGFEEPLSLELVISGQANEPLEQRLPQQLVINAASNASRRPEEWAINGTNIEFPNLADQSYSLKLRALSSSFALSDSVTTNWLLTNHPDLYFYGSLVHSAPWIKDDARIQTWGSFYIKALKEVQNNAHRSKAAIRLVTDIPTSGMRGGYNIYTDR